MSASAERPAHARLVDEIFERRNAWDRVLKRLDEFPSIAALLSSRAKAEEVTAAAIHALRTARRSRPYHVSPWAWRLGLWDSPEADRLVQDLSDRIQVAQAIPGWTEEVKQLRANDFGQFWAVLWQLQVAKLLRERCDHVEWCGGKGPDLKLRLHDREVFVECYAPRSRFEMPMFAEELLREATQTWTESGAEGFRFEVRYSYGGADSGKDKDLEPAQKSQFLDSLFCYIEANTEALRSEARTRSPILVRSPCDMDTAFEFRLYHEAAAEDLDIRGNPWPADVVQLELSRRIGEKRRQLARHRPNALLVNLLVIEQSRWIHSEGWKQLQIELPPEIDAVAVGVTGIDQGSARIERAWFREPGHPLRAILSQSDTP